MIPLLIILYLLVGTVVTGCVGYNAGGLELIDVILTRLFWPLIVLSSLVYNLLDS